MATIKEIKVSIVFDNGEEIPFEIKGKWKMDVSCDPETGEKSCVIKWGKEKGQA